MKSVSGRDFAHIIERRGWTLLRVNGSHHIHGKPGSVVRLSIPIHGNKPLKTGLLRQFGEARRDFRRRFLVCEPSRFAAIRWFTQRIAGLRRAGNARHFINEESNARKKSRFGKRFDKRLIAMSCSRTSMTR
jgi:predicted RNA binding protein YcfA (HicA-like mRNA interferase family)